MWRAWHDQITGAGHATRTTRIGLLIEPCDSIKQFRGRRLGGVGIAVCDVRTNVGQGAIARTNVKTR
jgi:hypothetical protein